MAIYNFISVPKVEESLDNKIYKEYIKLKAHEPKSSWTVALAPGIALAIPPLFTKRKLLSLGGVLGMAIGSALKMQDDAKINNARELLKYKGV